MNTCEMAVDLKEIARSINKIIYFENLRFMRGERL